MSKINNNEFLFILAISDNFIIHLWILLSNLGNYEIFTIQTSINDFK
jgi:hypothetical protein